MGIFFVLCFSLAIFLLKIQRGQQHTSAKDWKQTNPPPRPYMAGIFERRRLLCAGTVIKENWILTAAHCFPNSEMYIIFGADSRTKNERGKHMANITSIFSYPGFNPETFDNDIMLLKFKTVVKLHQAIKTIALPNTSIDLRAGTQCLEIGWGTIHGRKGYDKLHEDNVTIIDRNTCNNRNHYHSRPLLTRNMMCAGDKKGGKEICLTDSGGPLICDEVQRGIFSFVRRCSSSRYPGIYTRLTDDYLSWIQKITAQNKN